MPGAHSPGKAAETGPMRSMTRAPIAQVAGDAAAQAALDHLSREFDEARQDGRMALSLALDVIEARHLVRDRLDVSQDDMDVLKASLVARGQQTPIDVVETAPGQYGLVSGFRRLMALRALYEDTGDKRFASVKAFVRPAASMSQIYVAMVEENEVRADLSFYERANLALEAARMGIYPDPRTAVQTLFSAASPARRSKILSFVRLCDALDAALRFPTAIPERLGLALTKALERDDALGRKLKDTLRKLPATAQVADERAVLERALRKSTQASGSATTRSQVSSRKGSRSAAAEALALGIVLTAGDNEVTLKGQGVSAAFIRNLRAWIQDQDG